MKPIAALFVEEGGCYYGLDGVDPWGVTRDARLYNGPHPVVAHPPCQRWGAFWRGGIYRGESRFKKGDDGGCFIRTLEIIREFGGVLEHPRTSAAWQWFGLNVPPSDGGWILADTWGGYTCCVEQGHYGHRARKATMLYAVGCDLPSLRWGKSETDEVVGIAVKKKHKRSLFDFEPGHKKKAISAQVDREATPLEFRNILINMARSAHGYSTNNVPVATLFAMPEPVSLHYAIKE